MGSKYDDKDVLILSLLLPGEKGILSSHTLSALTGVPRKDIGFSISRLRKKGHLIGSKHGKGYFLIANRKEFDDTFAHIERRKRGIDRTLAVLTESWEKTYE